MLVFLGIRQRIWAGSLDLVAKLCPLILQMFLNFGKFRLKMSKNPTSTTDDSINYQSTSRYLQERGKNPHIPHIHKQIGLGAFWISIKKDHLQSLLFVITVTPCSLKLKRFLNNSKSRSTKHSYLIFLWLPFLMATFKKKKNYFF